MRNTVAEDEHNHEEHAGGKGKKKAARLQKEVELNEAQFKAANIELGTFAQRISARW
ncbi:hypothetical protein LRS05_00090 [Flavobacterium sp. J372]|uniref:hypothetical protein n=1 Tax=Flavobacterium sp. J372 TaxID=2898436 RepID=UPI0021518484|nr:hypothetical protein [Flavobacterium sp. J372]MCR5860660.1 hypothetical protein [Flavobacterium sp. J372]